MLLLLLTLLFVLGAGDNNKSIFLYHRAGDEVVLPCNSVDLSRTLCSNINWLDYRGIYDPHTIVHNGKIVKDSPQTAKLSLGSRCSLTITNISSEDAGRYICRDGKRIHQDTNVYLSILTLSADQSLDPEGGVTLTCSLWRYHRSYNHYCERGILLLLDEEGAELERKDEDKYSVCPSFLTITHQSKYNRQFTCQFLSDDEVKISANYTRVSAVYVLSDLSIFIIIGATVGLLTILAVVGLIVFIKARRRTGAAADAPKRAPVPDEPETNSEVHQPIQQASLMNEEESSVTYVAVSYRNRNQEASPSSEVREPEEEGEEVTYSTVKK